MAAPSATRCQARNGPNGRKSVSFDAPPTRTMLDFDIVVLRHGPPAGGFEVAFPDLYPASVAFSAGNWPPQRPHRRLSDATRGWHERVIS
jgi:hypothetical protein